MDRLEHRCKQALTATIIVGLLALAAIIFWTRVAEAAAGFLSSPVGYAPRPRTTVTRVVATPVPTAAPTARPVRVEVKRAVTKPSGRCGGDLPPCWVMMRESGGNPRAYNPTGCSGRGCYGKWQFDPRTGDGTGSEAEQDAEARRVWNHGKGCSHWNACG